MLLRDDLRQLDTYRLEHDLSFRALEDDMAQAGYRVDERTLHVLLSERDRRPNERTRYKIRRFLELRAPRQARDRRRGRALT